MYRTSVQPFFPVWGPNALCITFFQLWKSTTYLCCRIHGIDTVTAQEFLYPISVNLIIRLLDCLLDDCSFLQLPPDGISKGNNALPELSSLDTAECRTLFLGRTEMVNCLSHFRQIL